MRSKREGKADWRLRVTETVERSPMNRLLMLSRLIRCRVLAGQTADDAVLILEIFLIHDRKAVDYFTGAFRRSKNVTRAGGSSVDEAAKPDIHHQANRQKNKQRGGTPITHQR